MLKFELNLLLQFVCYEVIMPRNIFMNHSPPFCPHMRFFIRTLTLSLFNIMKWLSARTIIWLKLLALSYSTIRFLNVFRGGGGGGGGGGVGVGGGLLP